ncbi:MAG: DUF1499 domain-containing protein [Hyphomicrobiales bacterium]|nr:DUF1499 domain-containing protein [Hyphomicrobiales bacterium]
MAVIAVFYFAAIIILHRLGRIESTLVVNLLGVGFIILIISILFSVSAMIQLWSVGAKGGKKTIFGLSLSSIMISPFFYFAILAMRYPPINDVSTNVYSPPDFSEKTLDIRRLKGVKDVNDASGEIVEDNAEAILFTYPEVSSRRYPASSERVFKVVHEIVRDRGWNVTDIRRRDGTDTEANDAADDNTKAAKDDGLEQEAEKDIFVDAVTSTLFLSFKNDVVIKIVSEEDNTLVEMRSAGRWGRHDFGENARIIAKFMRDLDQNLIGISGDG